jgi:hypothetical protein
MNIMNLFLILRLFSIIVMGFWGGASLNQFKGTNPTARPYGLPGTGNDDDDQYYYCYSGGYYYDDDYYYCGMVTCSMGLGYFTSYVCKP